MNNQAQIDHDVVASVIQPPESRHTSRKFERRWWLLAILALPLLVMGKWLYQRSYMVSIDDARIASNIVSISSNRSGWITAFPAVSGQPVNANTLLAKIDTRAAELALKELDIQISAQQSEIQRAQEERELAEERYLSEINAQQARLDSARAQVIRVASEEQQAQSNFERSSSLRQKKLMSQQQWEDDQLALQQARQNTQSAQASLIEQEADLRKARVSLKTLELMDRKIQILQQQLNRLQVNRDQQQLDFDDRHIHSPISGIIDKTFVHNGEFVSAGRRLLMLHDPTDIWINANVKETDVRRLQPGMPASVHVDAYPDNTFTARVQRIDHATTSEFALLPNPNPSGNFTKVTQRLRVVLAIVQQDSQLKPGMMVTVDIDTRG